MLNRVTRYGIVLAALASSMEASSSPEAKSSSGNCWIDAGTYYQVDPWLLYTIAQKESGLNPKAFNRNKDQSYDIGLMQINSFFLPVLKKHGIEEQMLYDPCTNIKIGAWVLRQGMSIYGNNWRAVGAYNAGTSKQSSVEQRRERYANDVYRRYVDNYRRLQQQLAASGSAETSRGKAATIE